MALVAFQGQRSASAKTRGSSNEGLLQLLALQDPPMMSTEAATPPALAGTGRPSQTRTSCCVSLHREL